MKNLSLKAMLSCIKITNDYDLTALVKPQFSKQYGDPAFATVKDILRKEGDLNIAEACTSLMAVISDVDAVAEILSIIPDVRKEEKMPMDVIMELYRAEDTSCENMAKKYIVINFTNYVHDIIHTYYSTYSSKYWEELYHCGVIGLIKAMKNYDEKIGKFTTYCKRFVFHEISEQLNFHKNDSTVYFNNMQKKVMEAKEQLVRDGFEPTVENIALLTDLKPEMVKRELDVVERTRFCYLDDEEVTKQPSSYSMAPDQICIENEKKDALWESVSRLPDETMRKVIYLKYVYDMTNDVIAKRLKIQPGKVKTCHNRAIQMLHGNIDLRKHMNGVMDEASRQMLDYAQRPKATKAESDEKIDNLVSMNLFGNGEMEEDDSDPFINFT